MVTPTDWKALITIGVPCFNEERGIEESVRSAVDQCGALLLSDNASTDQTPAICARLAREFDHIRYIRHQNNLGAAENFRLLLEAARTPYFMWLGAHDRLPSGYVQALLGELHEDPSAVLAYGAVTHIDNTGVSRSDYDYFFAGALSSPSAETRALALIRWLTDCSLIHGLYRTSALRQAWANSSFLGGDHVLLTRLGSIGHFRYVPGMKYHRRTVRELDGPADQLLRISPTASSEPHHQQMMREQHRIVRELTRGRGLPGLRTRMRSAFYLAIRFGPFSERLIPRTLGKLLRSIGRLFRKVRSWRAASR